MTSLRQKLIEYIRIHGQVHFRDIEKYAEENKYKAYTAVRRLQEVRDPKDPNHYDPDIHIIDENGRIDGDGTIKWYIYKPAFAMKSQAIQEKPAPVEQIPVQPETARRIENTASQPKLPWQKQPDFHRPIHKCCQIAIACYEKGLSVMHSQGCETQKQIHS